MKHPLVNIATQAALAAGKIIMRAADRLDTVKVSEKSPNDFVTNVDQQAEREIIYHIRKAYPTHKIIAEESGESGEHEYTWVIDPLDGTRNFIHGFPHFAISIAILHNDRIEHGVIYDPIRQELFSASRGKGALLNNKRIRVSQQTQLEGSLLGTGFPYRQSEAMQTAHLDMLRWLIPICGDVRRGGAATLDLAYVACGRMDGFWELGLRSWDIAAGSLLIKEAGGVLADTLGGENYLATGNIVAGNPKMLKLLLQAIVPHMKA